MSPGTRKNGPNKAGNANMTVFRETILRWSDRNSRPYPWRRTSDPYRVLLSELLLQRTRGENVVPVYEAMLDRWPTPKHLARARQDSVARIMRPLGLAKRAALIRAFARVVVRDFSGRIPDDISDLQRLPAVGPYSANAVQVFARGQDLPLVDWVIGRVLRRYLGLPEGKRPNADKELWSAAEKLVERGRARNLWLGVLDFAAQVCAPIPHCDACPLQQSCRYYEASQRGATRRQTR